MIPEVFLDSVPDLDKLFIPDWWTDTSIPDKERLKYMESLQEEYSIFPEEEPEPQY